MFFLERWKMPPTVVDEQPLAFTRWAPGLVAASDAIREQNRKRAERAPSQQREGPRYGGGAW